MVKRTLIKDGKVVFFTEVFVCHVVCVSHKPLGKKKDIYTLFAKKKRSWDFLADGRKGGRKGCGIFPD